MNPFALTRDLMTMDQGCLRLYRAVPSRVAIDPLRSPKLTRMALEPPFP
jgi:hypothetical protein